MVTLSLRLRKQLKRKLKNKHSENIFTAGCPMVARLFCMAFYTANNCTFTYYFKMI